MPCDQISVKGGCSGIAYFITMSLACGAMAYVEIGYIAW